MKLGVLTCLWRRHGVARLCLAHLRHVQQSLAREGIDIIAVTVGSEGPMSEGVARSDSSALGHYVEAENSPLGAKWNTGMRTFKESGARPEGVVIMGSDDFISPDWFRWVAMAIGRGSLLGGARDLHYVTFGPRAIFWPGYHGHREGEPIGCGRFFSQQLLDDLDWAPWPDSVQRGLDFHSWRRTRPLVRDNRLTVETMAIAGRMFDLKVDREDISSYGSYEPISHPVAWSRVSSFLAPEIASGIERVAGTVPEHAIDLVPSANLGAMILASDPASLRTSVESLTGCMAEVVVCCEDEQAASYVSPTAYGAGCVVARAASRYAGSAGARNAGLLLARAKWVLCMTAGETLQNLGDLLTLVGDDRIDAQGITLAVRDPASSAVQVGLRVLRRSTTSFRYRAREEVAGVAVAVASSAVVSTSGVHDHLARHRVRELLMQDFADDSTDQHAAFHLTCEARATGDLLAAVEWGRRCIEIEPSTKWADCARLEVFRALVAADRFPEAMVMAGASVERMADSPQFWAEWIRALLGPWATASTAQLGASGASLVSIVSAAHGAARLVGAPLHPAALARVVRSLRAGETCGRSEAV